MVEDVLVKVDKFIFPVDFVIMDMKKDEEVPLILGIPFMKTARIIVDVDKGELRVKAQNEEVIFNLSDDVNKCNAGKDGLQEDAPKHKALPTIEEQMDVSKSIEKVIPH